MSSLLSSHPLLSSSSAFRCSGSLVLRQKATGSRFAAALLRRRPARGASRGSKFSGAYRVLCCLQEEVVQVRRFCPILEGETFQNQKELGSREWQAVPDIWKSSAEKFGDRIALVDRYHDPPSKLTFKQLEQEILFFSEGLRVLGVYPEEKIAMFADNSCRWLIADQGIMATGAINVVRGTRSTDEELLQIYRHSESTALVLDNPDFFRRLSETWIQGANSKFIILLWGDKSDITKITTQDRPIFTYEEVINLGKSSRCSTNATLKSGQHKYEEISPDDIATLIYTSGTTGSPKGVMLTHKNLLHQINSLWEIVPAENGDMFLSVLPPWHVYERSCEYFYLAFGAQQVYTNVKNLKEDLRLYQPQYFIAVPLIFETLYRGIQKQISTSSAVRKFIALSLLKISMLYMEMKRIYEGRVLTEAKGQTNFILDLFDWLGARVFAAILWPLHHLALKLVYSKIRAAIGISKAAISGGGSLPFYVDRFFEAIGMKVLNGYGLTETSPVIAARQSTCNVLGTIGHPIQDTEVKIVDLETGIVLPDGSKGLVKARGPQVMKGYYKNSYATEQVLDNDGWLNTGDIGWIAPKHSPGRSRCTGGMIVIEGRVKDTIVLSTGENVEPSILEEAALRSNLIQQIVVIGQDQRRLGALIVPNREELLASAKTSSLVPHDASEIETGIGMKLLHNELTKWTSGCSFKIGPILIVDEPFTIDNGLMTPTMKVRRDRVATKYSHQIANLFK